MKKFVKDLSEVGKDICSGLAFVFLHTVWFVWDTKETFIEHCTNLIRYINRYRRPDRKNDSIVISPATAEVMNNVVKG